MTIKKRVEIEIPLDGLADMEMAEAILLELEEAVMLDHSPDAGKIAIIPAGDGDLRTIDRMKREINKGGTGYKMWVAAGLVAEDAEVPEVEA